MNIALIISVLKTTTIRVNKMASPVSDSSSKALIVRDPTLPDAIRTPLDEMTDAVIRRSLEIAKYEASHLPLIAFTGRNIVSISSMTLSPPEGLGTDSSIGVEIFKPATTDPNSPVIIFSHGMGVSSAHYRPLLEELASHGYVVLSLTHPSGVEDLPGDGAERAARVAPIMANNIQFVLKQVQEGALKGIGDAGRIVLAGHSIGGAASVIVAGNDPHVVGCVNLDGWLEGRRADRLEQPFLLLRGDYQSALEASAKSPDENERNWVALASRKDAELETFVRHSPHSKQIIIPGATHMDFTDAPYAIRVNTIASRAMLDFLSTCTR
jgi:pimeloyl-ACP methyl ester carboxylesterase